ncbi:hypothetical protein Q9F39_004201 [Vibrio fluvialis]|nr:hypothetical protein [Vibrio fluvialis]
MNRLEMLKKNLQAARAGREITNQDLADLTGFSRPSISDAINTGKINHRLDRCLDLIELVAHAYHITALFDLMARDNKEPLSLPEFVGSRVERGLNKVLEENQIDLVDEYGRPDVPDWFPLQLKDSQAELTDEQLAKTIEIGAISQDAAIGYAQSLIKKSSKTDAKAKQKNSDQSAKIDSFKSYCENVINHNFSGKVSEEACNEISKKLVDVISQLNLDGQITLGGFRLNLSFVIEDIARSNSNLEQYLNSRLLRVAIRDSEHMKSFFQEGDE